ncbi:MAG: hypothetical protein ACWIPJ_08775 [Polaribacter sp.]
MEDKFHQFFSENNFDLQEPPTGHLKRFERTLNHPKKIKKKSWKWLSAAASVILIFGFWLGNNHQKSQVDLADISPKMKEVQHYFVSAIHQEVKTLEKNRSLQTETIVENALHALNNLEDNYKVFVQELTKNGKHRRIISAMIKNYQMRLDILERTLEQIEKIKNSKIPKNETYL